MSTEIPSSEACKFSCPRLLQVQRKARISNKPSQGIGCLLFMLVERRCAGLTSLILAALSPQVLALACRGRGVRSSHTWLLTAQCQMSRENKPA